MIGPADKGGAVTSTGTAKALLCDAYVGKGGRLAEAHDSDAVHIYLMNVLTSSDTSLAIRCGLLERVLASIDLTGRVVLLTPAGFFGYDSPYTDSPRWLDRNALDRARAVKYLRSLNLRSGLLLAVGVDQEEGSPQALHVIEGGATTRYYEILRNQSSHAERLFSFGGLTFFGVVCGEFMLDAKQGPMSKHPEWFFDANQDIRGKGIDVVLNAAHREVKCTQVPGAATNRYPFETFFRDVSKTGAACFLAHHHPHERHPLGYPKYHSYSNWGMYTGKGRSSDWMSETNHVMEIDIP